MSGSRPAPGSLRRRPALGWMLLALPAWTRAAATAPGSAASAPPVLAPSAPAPAEDDGRVQRGRALVFPRDHGAHAGARTEWWYATGWLGGEHAPTHGFQVTFFRSRTGLAEDSASRFAPRQLLFAHAAITDLAARRHVHAARIARWNGDAHARPDRAARDDADISLGRWRLVREQPPGSPSRWRAHVVDDAFELALDLERTQPLLLQGDAGFSRKGPQEHQASHYYSDVQLAARARVALAGRPALQAGGRAWMDQEWSNELLHPDAVGWDWIGMNLFDGSALTAFRLRRAAAPDGSPGAALWAGGSFRAAGGPASAFGADAVHFTPGRRWRSVATHALYPVEWLVQTPAGRFGVRALVDAQELAGPGTTGAVYWEGLSELLDAGGRRVGLGYLEMTGYAGRLRLG